ncbi:MAG: tetratricopeptide repeat protein [Mangrovibacterium sp.]
MAERDQAKIDAKQYAEQAKLLEEQFNNQRKQLEELAEKFARENFDDFTGVQKQAADAFISGNIEEALRILGTVNSEEEIAKAMHQKEKGEKLVAEGTQMREEADSIIQQNIRKLMFQADLYKTTFRFDDAEKAYETAVNADTTNFENVCEYASFLGIRRKYEKALKWYQENAFPLVVTEGDKARVLKSIGDLHIKLGQFDKAKESLITAIDLFKILSSDEHYTDEYHLALESALNSYGAVLMNTNEFDKAEQYLLEALRVNESTLLHNFHTPHKALTLQQLATVQRQKGEYEKAEARYLEALHLYRDYTDGKKGALSVDQLNFANVHIADLLNDLAVISTDMNHMENAVNYYSESINLLKPLARINPESFNYLLSVIQANLGELQLHINQLEDAEVNLTDAIKIQRLIDKSTPSFENSDILSKALYSLGTLQVLTNRKIQAEASYSESIGKLKSLVQSNPQKYNQFLAATFTDLANLQLSMNNLDSAETNYSNAVELYRDLVFDQPDAFEHYLAQTHNLLGYTQLMMAKYDKAEISYKESLTLFKHLAQKDSQAKPLLAMVYNNLAWIEYKYRNDINEAIKETNSAIEIHQNLSDINPAVNVDFVLCLNRMARYRILKEDFHQAEVLAWESLKKTGTNEILRMSCEKNLAHALLYENKYDQARELYIKLGSNGSVRNQILADLDEFENAGITHPDIAKIRKLLK